jgi:molybdopterin-guanine dinucleotide biosynthesis protein A
VKAVFLCGGIGRRMFPFSGDKFRLQFLGKTLLKHGTLALVEEGTPVIAVCPQDLYLCRDSVQYRRDQGPRGVCYRCFRLAGREL